MCCFDVHGTLLWWVEIVGNILQLWHGQWSCIYHCNLSYLSDTQAIVKRTMVKILQNFGQNMTEEKYCLNMSQQQYCTCSSLVLYMQKQNSNCPVESCCWKFFSFKTIYIKYIQKPVDYYRDSYSSHTAEMSERMTISSINHTTRSSSKIQ